MSKLSNDLIKQIIKTNTKGLYEQDGKGDEAKVTIKLMSLFSDWEWYVTEARIEDNDITFFGLVKGFETELGYFTLNEFDNVNRNTQAIIILETGFKPRSLGHVREELRERY